MYDKLDKELLVSLLKNFAGIPMDLEGDAFGRIYKYFLGKFDMSEGAKGGEFFTPLSIVKLMVEIIEAVPRSDLRLGVRLRGALRAVKRVAKMNLSFTPEDMLK